MRRLIIKQDYEEEKALCKSTGWHLVVLFVLEMHFFYFIFYFDLVICITIIVTLSSVTVKAN